MASDHSPILLIELVQPWVPGELGTAALRLISWRSLWLLNSQTSWVITLPVDCSVFTEDSEFSAFKDTRRKGFQVFV